jgi:hypothetical protein
MGSVTLWRSILLALHLLWLYGFGWNHEVLQNSEPRLCRPLLRSQQPPR